ncbi:MAG: DUF4386 domain-containing protein [Reichenbachiella sp.]|uniref:DUF4386 domain-containing protein n=1 Tax=Reichenbachiella sp. TaxID=2184521 RepID=UPI003263BE78
MINLGPNKPTARLAGFLFLLLIVTGVFSEFFVRQEIFVADDALATANNIAANALLFRIGMVSDLVMTLAYFFFGLVVYQLLKSIDKFQAQLLVASVLICVSIYSINMLNHAAPLILLSGQDYLSGFDTNQLNALVTFFLELHGTGYYVSQIFFGLYLFPLGYLVYKSGWFPKAIGVLLMLGGLGDMIDLLWFFLYPDFDTENLILLNLTLPADLGEFSLCLWMMIMGIRQPKVDII